MTKHRVERESRRHPGVRVMKLPGRGWCARWNDPLSGKLTQQNLERLGCSNARQRTDWAVAKAAELKRLRRAASLGTIATERRPVAQVVDEYLDGVAHPATRTGKRPGLQEFVVWCTASGVRNTAQLTAPLLLRFRDAMLVPGASKRRASTRNLRLSVVGTFLRWCLKRGLVPLLTSDSIRAQAEPVRLPARAVEFLRPAQIRAVLAAAIEHDRLGLWRCEAAPFSLALLTAGGRFAELSELIWSEVDLDAGELRLDAARVKTRVGRTIDLGISPSLWRLLEALRQRDPDGERVFHWPKRSSWAVAAARVSKLAGVRFTPQIARRTVGTILTCAPAIFGAASAYQSARRLGHSVVIAERIYTGLLRDLPATARTIEAAAGIEDLAETIVARVRGA